MIWDTKKFNREAGRLKELFGQNDALTKAELASIKQRVVLAVQNLPNPIAYKAGVKTPNLEAVARQAIAILLGLSLIGGTAFASDRAIPGDVLYPVKRATESLRLGLALTDQSRANLKAQFAGERINELKELKNESLQSGKNSPPPAASNSPSSTQQIIAPVPTTTPQNPKPQNGHGSLETQAQAEASMEVNSALSALQKVKTKLEAQGNSTAAGAVSQNITKLQSDAQSQGIKINFDGDDSQNNGQSDKHNGSENNDNGHQGRGSDGQLPSSNQNPLLPQVSGTSTFFPNPNKQGRKHD